MKYENINYYLHTIYEKPRRNFTITDVDKPRRKFTIKNIFN